MRVTNDLFVDIDVKVLRLEPGDVIALRSRDPLTVEQAVDLRAQAEVAFGGRTVVVLTGDIDLVVVREAEPIEAA